MYEKEEVMKSSYGAGVSGDWALDADLAEVITEVFRWLENESDACE